MSLSSSLSIFHHCHFHYLFRHFVLIDTLYHHFHVLNSLPWLIEDFADPVEHLSIFGRAEIHSKESFEEVLEGNDEVKQIFSEEAARQPFFVNLVDSFFFLLRNSRIYISKTRRTANKGRQWKIMISFT